MGALIMTHSDDTGFVCPPKIAGTQIVIVCIWKNADQKGTVIQAAENVKSRLEDAGYRVDIDARDGMRPGARYYEWERKVRASFPETSPASPITTFLSCSAGLLNQGVPLRMELGPRDVENGAVFCARRIGGAKFSVATDENLEARVAEVLEGIQQELFDVAKTRLEESTRTVSSYQEMKDAFEAGNTGFFLVPWKDDAENEVKIKDECKATIR